MKQSKKLNEGIRIAKEGIEECWDDMGGQEMTNGEQGEQMSVTISMPGKNISVTTDSADEIGNILRLAGITMGGASAEMPGEEPGEEPGEMPGEEPSIMYVGAQEPVAGDNDGDGDHDMHDHEIEDSNDSEEEPEEEESEEEDEVEEATQTPSSWTDKQGETHPATKVQGDRYGNGTEDGAEPTPKRTAMIDKDEFDESARILQLAGVTNEAQSAAQKAAFAKMIAKKNGGKSEDKADDKDDNKKPDADGDGKPDWADKDEEVKEDTPVTNSIFGQGVYEQSYARILELAGVTESKLMNSPANTSMDEPKVYHSLPSGKGTGAGRKDYGANRANNQGENPMGPADLVDKVYSTSPKADVEEAFSTAMGEYRKFVAEKIATKK